MDKIERINSIIEQTRESEQRELERQAAARAEVAEVEAERARKRYEAHKARIDEKERSREEKAVRRGERTEERRKLHMAKRELRIANAHLAFVRNEPPVLTRMEEFGNYASHGLGVLLAVAGLVLLLVKSNTGMKVMASLFYGISMILMFLDSALYHGMPAGSRVKRILRRFDYSSIYLLIGGTFAPVFLIYWGTTAAVVLFCVQWGLIVGGILLLAVFGPGRYYWVHNLLYFVIGWSAIAFLPGWWMHNRPLFWMVLAGGVIYTVGMIPFVRDKRGDHFIFHLFVLAAAVVHWFAIYFFIY